MPVKNSAENLSNLECPDQLDVNEGRTGLSFDSGETPWREVSPEGRRSCFAAIVFALPGRDVFQLVTGCMRGFRVDWKMEQ